MSKSQHPAMSAAPSVTFMGQASGDPDLDPFEVHVFPIAIRHLTSSPRPQFRSIRVAARQAPTWPCRRVRSHPLGMGCGTGPTRQHRPGSRELLPGRCPAPRPGHGEQSLLPAQTAAASRPQVGVPKGDAKPPLLSPRWTPVETDPAADCDLAGLREKAGEGERLGGRTAAARGTEGLSWGLPHHFTR